MAKMNFGTAPLPQHISLTVSEAQTAHGLARIREATAAGKLVIIDYDPETMFKPQGLDIDLAAMEEEAKMTSVYNRVRDFAKQFDLNFVTHTVGDAHGDQRGFMIGSEILEPR